MNAEVCSVNSQHVVCNYKVALKYTAMLPHQHLFNIARNSIDSFARPVVNSDGKISKFTWRLTSTVGQVILFLPVILPRDSTRIMLDLTTMQCRTNDRCFLFPICDGEFLGMKSFLFIWECENYRFMTYRPYICLGLLWRKLIKLI